MIPSDCVVSAVDFGMKQSTKNPKVDRNFNCVNIADVWTASCHTAKIYWCWNMLGKDKVFTVSNSFRFVTLEGLPFPFTTVLCSLLLLMLLSVPWCRSFTWEQTSKGIMPWGHNRVIRCKQVKHGMWKHWWHDKLLLDQS